MYSERELSRYAEVVTWIAPVKLPNLTREVERRGRELTAIVTPAMADDDADLCCPICLTVYNLLSRQPRMLLYCAAVRMRFVPSASACCLLYATPSPAHNVERRFERIPNPNRGLLAALKLSMQANEREIAATAAASEEAAAQAASAERNAEKAMRKFERQRTEGAYGNSFSWLALPGYDPSSLGRRRIKRSRTFVWRDSLLPTVPRRCCTCACSRSASSLRRQRG